MRSFAAVLLALAILLVGAPLPVLGEGPAAPPLPDPPLPAGLAEGWYAKIDTSLGRIVVHLLPEQAPQSVAHFAAFAEGRLSWVDPLTGSTKKQNYYDGLKVHLATAGQRFEAGDPTETGRGAPLVYVPLEASGPIDFGKGWRMGLTRASLGRINGALFFITTAPIPYLSAQHPCIGDVVVGRDVVTAICNVRTNPRGQPLDPIVLRRVRIVPVGNPAPLPQPVPFKPKPPKFGLKEPVAPAN